MGTVMSGGGVRCLIARCGLHEMGDVIDGVCGEVCGGISGILTMNVVVEGEEEDSLEVGRGDVQTVNSR